MDRNAELVTHLAHLVALYAGGEVNANAERGALRAARTAAKHGACDVMMGDGAMRAGGLDMAAAPPDVAAIETLMLALGISRVHVQHHAKQEEIKRLAELLGGVAAGRTAPSEFAATVAGQEWHQVHLEFAAEAAAGGAGDDATAAGTATPTADDVMTVALPTPPEPAGNTPPPSLVINESVAAPDVESSAGPLADRVPDAVATITPARYLELFEHLITASTPSTLRRFLDPIQMAVEQCVREGKVADAVHLFLAMLQCEACTNDDEMRRMFVVSVRRLTKPTLLRAFAMLYGDAPVLAADVEAALQRFGEDGAEAVADCIGTATTAEGRQAYTALLGRLPAARDAVMAMLDDERAIVVERAVDVLVAIKHPDTERLLAELLSHASARVRQAAARGLGGTSGSAFAADALLRAVQDASADVRLAAAVSLQSRREQRLAAPLAQLIDDEVEIEVQLALISVLGRLGASDGVQKLIALANPNERMLRRRNPAALRLSAIEALGEARTPAAMAALQKLLEDREKDVREAAARLYSRARRQTSSMSVPAVTDG